MFKVQSYNESYKSSDGASSGQKTQFVIGFVCIKTIVTLQCVMFWVMVGFFDTSHCLISCLEQKPLRSDIVLLDRNLSLAMR